MSISDLIGRRKAELHQEFGDLVSDEYIHKLVDLTYKSQNLPKSYRPKISPNERDLEDDVNGQEMWITRLHAFQRAVQDYIDEDEMFEFADTFWMGQLRVYWPNLRAAEKALTCRMITDEDIDLVDRGDDELRIMADNSAEHMAKERRKIKEPLSLEQTITWRKQSDPKWWIRQYRKRRDVTEAHLAWLYGRTGGNRRAWCSDEAFDNKAYALQWQSKWLDTHFMRRVEDGAVKTMRQLYDDTIDGKKAEDYAIALGLQQICEASNLKFVMCTVTNTGEWSPVRGRRASVYNGCSPAEANKELKSRLKLIRTALGDRGIEHIGFAVTEPQESGSPHAHVLILTSDPDWVKRTFLEYKEHENHQIDVRDWSEDTNKAKAQIASYLFKYLNKNSALEGEGDSVAYAAWRSGARCRTTAWWGLGRGFKGKWRAIYRSDITCNSPVKTVVIQDPAFLAAKEAMNDRNWGKALAIVAGLDRIQLKWNDETRVSKTVYGEERKVREGYVMANGQVLPLRTGTWELNETPKLVREEEISAVSVRYSREAPPAPAAAVPPCVEGPSAAAVAIDPVTFLHHSDSRHAPPVIPGGLIELLNSLRRQPA